jgi:hypothetical protein
MHWDSGYNTEEFAKPNLCFNFQPCKVIGFILIQSLMHVGVNKMELHSKREMNKEYTLSTCLKHFYVLTHFSLCWHFKSFFLNLTIIKTLITSVKFHENNKNNCKCKWKDNNSNQPWDVSCQFLPHLWESQVLY